MCGCLCVQGVLNPPVKWRWEKRCWIKCVSAEKSRSCSLSTLMRTAVLTCSRPLRSEQNDSTSPAEKAEETSWWLFIFSGINALRHGLTFHPCLLLSHRAWTSSRNRSLVMAGKAKAPERKETEKQEDLSMPPCNIDSADYFLKHVFFSAELSLHLSGLRGWKWVIRQDHGHFFGWIKEIRKTPSVP